MGVVGGVRVSHGAERPRSPGRRLPSAGPLTATLLLGIEAMATSVLAVNVCGPSPHAPQKGSRSGTEECLETTGPSLSVRGAAVAPSQASCGGLPCSL